MKHLIKTSYVKILLLLGFISFMSGSIYKQFGIISFSLSILGSILMMICITNLSLRKYVDERNEKNDV